MTANRLDSVGPNKWRQFLAYDIRDWIGPAKPMQNRNRYLCVWSLDSHRARGQSIHATLHPAMCRFVIRSMANFHGWIRMANDGVRWNKILAATVDTSNVNKKNTKTKWVLRENQQFVSITLHGHILHVPFPGQFVSLAVAFPQQSSIQLQPFRVSVQFWRRHVYVGKKLKSYFRCDEDIK